MPVPSSPLKGEEKIKMATLSLAKKDLRVLMKHTLSRVSKESVAYQSGFNITYI